MKYLVITEKTPLFTTIRTATVTKLNITEAIRSRIVIQLNSHHKKVIIFSGVDPRGNKNNSRLFLAHLLRVSCYGRQMIFRYYGVNPPGGADVRFLYFKSN